MNARVTLIVLCAGALALAAAPLEGATGDVQRQPAQQRLEARPDLLVAAASVERLALLPDGSHRVRVSATVRCAAPIPTTCSAFKILAEYRDGRVGPYTRLGEAGVASLSSGSPTHAVIPSETRTFEDVVPSGRARAYRVTVDSGNMVAETNETNNQGSTVYRATGCAGSDLVLTRVELVRHHAGAVVHVWVRNRCLEPCVADIVYTIDEHEVLPGSLRIEQPIGSRIDGDTEVGPLGNVAAGGREGADVIYTIGVEARGGTCRDSNPANNTCRVTLPVGQASRVITCNR